MYRSSKSSQIIQTQSVMTLSDIQYSFNFEISPSHLTISHNFATCIKPKTYYQLYLIKDKHQSSEVNQYQNHPINARVFQGKIVISNAHLSFSVDCDKQFRALNSYYLRLVQLNTYQSEQYIVIGEYQLNMDEYINIFRKQQSNYFYQECVIHPQVYLTYELFVEKTRLRLEYLIRQIKKRQKQQMKEHIMRSLQQKKKHIQKLQPNSEDQKQLKQVVKAHLTVLNHLEINQNQNDAQSEHNFQHTKLLLRSDDLPIQSPAFSLKNTIKDTLEILSEERDHISLQSSKIDVREEIQMSKPKRYTVRKAASLADQMKGVRSKQNSSVILRNDSSSLLKNQSSLILIDVKLPQIHQFRSHQNSSIINFKSQNSSQLSLNNEFQQAIKRIMENQRIMRNKNIGNSAILYQFGTQNQSIQLMRNDQQDSDKRNFSQITINSSIYSKEVRRTKFLVFSICIVAFLLFVSLIDHPYFDFFQNSNDFVVDDDYLQNKKRKISKKDMHRNKKRHKAPQNKEKK